MFDVVKHRDMVSSGLLKARFVGAAGLLPGITFCRACCSALSLAARPAVYFHPV